MKEETFESILQRYNAAFFQCHGIYPFKIFYASGWVHLQSREDMSVLKYRASEFQRMADTLEARAARTEQRTGTPPDNATELPRLTPEQLAQTLSLAIVQAGGNRDTVKAAFRSLFDKSPELARLISQTLANWEADKILQQ